MSDKKEEGQEKTFHDFFQEAFHEVIKEEAQALLDDLEKGKSPFKGELMKQEAQALLGDLEKEKSPFKLVLEGGETRSNEK